MSPADFDRLTDRTRLRPASLKMARRILVDGLSAARAARAAARAAWAAWDAAADAAWAATRAAEREWQAAELIRICEEPA